LFSSPDLPHPTRTPIAPIAPPLAAPQPSWKQELRQEPPAVAPPATGEPPKEENK
jgi:hypothetical protein